MLTVLTVISTKSRAEAGDTTDKKRLASASARYRTSTGTCLNLLTSGRLLPPACRLLAAACWLPIPVTWQGKPTLLPGVPALHTISPYAFFLMHREHGRNHVDTHVMTLTMASLLGPIIAAKSQGKAAIGFIF